MQLTLPPFRFRGLFFLALSLAAFFSLFSAGVAQAGEPRWGRLYTISGTLPVRENPADDALKVRVLKAGQKVRVDFQDAGWAAVFDPKEPARSELKALGYVRLDELHLHGVAATASASSIEVRKPRPAAKPAAKPDAKPDVKPDLKTDAKTEGAPKGKQDKPSAKEPEKAASTGKADSAASTPTLKPAPLPAAKPGKSFGEIRVPDRDLALRASRTAESEFKRVLRPGQRVLVDFWEDGWFAVFDPAEKKRDLAKALGYSRDKYLVPESAYAGPPPGSALTAPAVPAAPVESAQLPAKVEKPKSSEEPRVGYAVVERKVEQGVVTLHVRLDYAKPPAPEVLRKIVREIWKTERKKDEDLQLELLLMGMDAHGLSYATARFHADGRIREFWWREVVLGHAEK